MTDCVEWKSLPTEAADWLDSNPSPPQEWTDWQLWLVNEVKPKLIKDCS